MSNKTTQIESDNFEFGALIKLLESAAGLAAHRKVSQEVRDFIHQAKRETYFLAQRNLADVYPTKEQNDFAKAAEIMSWTQQRTS